MKDNVLYAAIMRSIASGAFHREVARRTGFGDG